MEAIVGVYCITNLFSGERYVGQSRDVLKRRADHKRLLARGKHSNRLLQVSFRDSGMLAFGFEILEVVPSGLNNLEVFNWLNSKECFYVKSLKASLNMAGTPRPLTNCFVDECGRICNFDPSKTECNR